MAISCFSTITLKIDEFDEIYTKIAPFYNTLFLIVRLMTLAGMWYLCLDGGTWMFNEMWKGTEYGILNLEFH